LAIAVLSSTSSLRFRERHPVSPAPTPEDLLVFYEPNPEVWKRKCKAMLAAGFEEVKPFNPYWAKTGRTFEDKDRYRVVIQRAVWVDET
jgi:YycE-like C-terminal domain